MIEEGHKLCHKCGSPSYIAPEILRNKTYDFKADIFGLGSIMFNLVTGNFLFYSNDVNEILRLNKLCNLSHVPEKTKSLS